MHKIPVGISNRHIHLSQEHVEQLFGEGHQLKPMKELSQPGQFAAEEIVTIVGPKGEIPKVRILGPARGSTQLEISRTDSFALGISAPVRQSGDIDGTPGIIIKGPNGELEIEQGVIIAARHVHLHPREAEELNLKNNQRIKLRTSGERSLIFDNVLVRVHDQFAKDFHIDTDEGNAALLKNGDLVEVVLD